MTRHLAVIAAGIFVALMQPATAAPVTCNDHGCSDWSGSPPAGRSSGRAHRGNIEWDRGRVVDHPSGCPRSLFCGCGVSVYVFGHPIKSLFLAAAYGRFPQTSSPGPRDVAYRRGHALAFMSVSGNQATIYNPNSGRRLTRVQTVTLSALRAKGYRFVSPLSGKAAL